MTQQTIQNESFADLVRDILSDMRQLLREEIALARVEIREQASRAKAAGAALGVGVGALAIGAVFLLIAIAVAIADFLAWPVWTGFLIVALLLGVGGFAALASGRRQLQQVRAVPKETVSTLKENSTWIAKHLSSERK
jgi:Putative Actinobacterial Holin-X, holin superfamily III